MACPTSSLSPMGEGIAAVPLQSDAPGHSHVGRVARTQPHPGLARGTPGLWVAVAGRYHAAARRLACAPGARPGDPCHVPVACCAAQVGSQRSTAATACVQAVAWITGWEHAVVAAASRALPLWATVAVMQVAPPCSLRPRSLAPPRTEWWRHSARDRWGVAVPPPAAPIADGPTETIRARVVHLPSLRTPACPRVRQTSRLTWDTLCLKIVSL